VNFRLTVAVSAHSALGKIVGRSMWGTKIIAKH
jgi:hypothetical protein